MSGVYDPLQPFLRLVTQYRFQIVGFRNQLADRSFKSSCNVDQRVNEYLLTAFLNVDY